MFARDDVAVHLDRDALLDQFELANQVRDGGPFGHVARIPVERDAHGENLVVAFYLYNRGAIW